MTWFDACLVHFLSVLVVVVALGKPICRGGKGSLKAPDYYLLKGRVGNGGFDPVYVT
jgi:hypothetical protein